MRDKIFYQIHLQAFNLAFKLWQAEQETKGEVGKDTLEEGKEETKCKDEGRLSVSYSKEEEKSLIHMGSGGGDGGQLVVERRGRGGELGGGGRGEGGLLIDLAPPRVEVDSNPSTDPLMDREQEEEDMMMSFTQ